LPIVADLSTAKSAFRIEGLVAMHIRSIAGTVYPLKAQSRVGGVPSITAVDADVEAGPRLDQWPVFIAAAGEGLRCPVHIRCICRSECGNACQRESQKPNTIFFHWYSPSSSHAAKLAPKLGRSNTSLAQGRAAVIGAPQRQKTNKRQ